MAKRAEESARLESDFASRDVTGLKASTSREVKFSWKLALVFIWIGTTVALATWWLIYGLQQIERISELNLGGATEIARWHRMYVSEGATLVFLLFAGGAALLYYILTEVRRTRRVREFFAAFTHDLKNSLASLRLQAESLEEDLQGSQQAKLARRLVKDTVRLALQLENSLFLASAEDAALHIERLDIGRELKSIRAAWPDLEIEFEGSAHVQADSRAFESIVKNLIQNAVVHGRATRVHITVTGEGGARVCLRIQDNGRGFTGDAAKLGRLFHRPTGSSGSGIGLYLVARLTRRMQGETRIVQVPSETGVRFNDAKGFAVDVILPGALGGETFEEEEA